MSKKIDRRGFIKVAGLSIGLSFPIISGYAIYRSAEGEFTGDSLLYAFSEDITISNQSAENCPILFILGDQKISPFTNYFQEILIAEGFNCFEVASTQDISKEYLDRFDILLVAEDISYELYQELLLPYVQAGGRLIASRPTTELASFFGMKSLSGGISNGYIRFSNDLPVRDAIKDQALQFRGKADKYLPIAGTPLAWIQETSTRFDSCVGVGINRWGDGLAAFWAFDLAKSIIYSRQGNPAWADRPSDNWDGIRAINLYDGWLDLDRIHLPQADELQRLFGYVLHLLSEGRKPLPRIWYFPENASTVLIATGDSHMNPAHAIEEVLSTVETFDGKMTIYYSPDPNTQFRRGLKRLALRMKHLPVVGELISQRVVSPSQNNVQEWRKRGHEFALHPWVEEGLTAGWASYWREFSGLGYGEVPPTARTHRILWKGWTETAAFQASLGIRMNFDYYHWGPIFQTADGKWKFGHFTGSGRPMRFIDSNGQILEIFQQITQLADDHILDLHWGGIAKLSPSEGILVAREMIENSLEGSFCAIGTNFHVDPFAIGGETKQKARTFLCGVLNHARSQNIPITNAMDWQEFTENRHQAYFSEIVWREEDHQLICNFTSEATLLGRMSILIPQQFNGKSLSRIQLNGKPQPVKQRILGGITYGSVLTAGKHNLIHAQYSV